MEHSHEEVGKMGSRAKAGLYFKMDTLVVIRHF